MLSAEEPANEDGGSASAGAYLGGISSCSGSSLAWTYQSGRDPQKMFCVGLSCGSPSSEPAGMMTTFPLFDSHGKVEPQFLQKQVAKYLVFSGS